MTKVKGYKAFDSKLKCRDFQFKVGRIYEIDTPLKLCNNGFHFCENFFDVYQYYKKSTETRICEIEAIGPVQKENDKSCTSKIKIVKELDHSEILELFMKNNNSGDWNSGYGNSGNRNSGDRNSGDGNSGYGNSGYGNSGDWNSGYGNSGNRNSGDRNSGDGNSGNRNSGDGNSGNRNSGYGNSGNRNSGDWNSGDGNSGYFNTTIPIYFFNKPSDTKWTEKLQSKLRSLNVLPILSWVSSDSMTDEEKNNNPSYKVTGGFLRKTGRHDWRKLTDKDKEFIKSLPNFDDEIFKVISNGVSLVEPKTVKISHNGSDYEIDIEKAKELGIIKK